jgi:hypothetical protein
MQQQLNQEPASDDKAIEGEQPKDGTPEAVASKPPEDGGKENSKQSETQATDKGQEPKKSAQPEKDEIDWKARFDGMKALYDREVPKLRSELEHSYEQIDSLKKEFETFKEEIAQKADETSKPPADLNLTDDEQEQYGGLINIVQKVADQRVAEKDAQIAKLTEKLATLEAGQKEIKQDTATSREQNFFNELARAVPDWRTINTDEGFIQFLEEPVPYTGGRTRRDFLSDARKQLDAVGAAQFFLDFKENSKVSDSGESQPDEPEVPAVPEEIVVPNTASGGIPPVEQLKVYTHADVDRFYRDKREGRYKGREEEARKIEQDILAAGTQGRIVARVAPATT